jgi:hypothetical protein
LKEGHLEVSAHTIAVLEAALKQKTELLFAIHSVSVRDR